VAAGSVLANDVHILSLATAVTAAEGGDWYVAAGSVMVSETLFAGSYVGADVYVAGITLATTDADMVVKSGSILTTGSVLAGSTVGADVALSGTLINKSDMLLKSGSILAGSSILKAGTYLTQDVSGTTATITATGTVFKAGTVLSEDLTINFAGATTHLLLTADMTVKAGSTLTINKYAANTANGVSLQNSETNRLSDVDVLTQEGAQKAIAIADAALKDLDKTRSDLGSVQNQLTSTIANISVTRVNIYAAESSIRDVDFAEESANFTKMQILMQAGTFAMAQSNASAQNVLQLLQ
jgi:flagellin